MSEPSVGKEIVGYCGKCKLTLAHLIMAMDGSRIVKAQCKTCKAIHGHRSAPGSVKRKTAPRTRKKVETRSVREIWNEQITQANQTPETYSIKKTFKKGDVISHPKFGEGVVQSLVDNKKIEVLFQMDYKTLVHGV